MKYTTSNVKNGDYAENHVLYVGTQTGSFKSKSHFFVSFFLPLIHMSRNNI